MKQVLTHFAGLGVFLIAVNIIAGAIGVSGQEAPSGDRTIETLSFEYDIRREEVAKPIRRLQESYEVQLNSLREQMRGAGDLEKVLTVSAEIEALRGGDAKPGRQTFPELQRLQTIYKNELKKRMDLAYSSLPALVQVHRANLTALMQRLTTQDELDEAIKVKEALENVDESLAIAVREPALGSALAPAVIAWEGKTVLFDLQKKQFSNRGYVWKSIPEEFRGWQMSMRAGKDKAQTVIKVKSRGMVYVVIGSEVDAKSIFEEDGWTVVDTLLGGLKGTQKYMLVKKILVPGTYTLPSTKEFLVPRILLPPDAPQKPIFDVG